MGPELELKDKSETMIEVASNTNQNEGLPHDSKDKFMNFVSNCEDPNFGNGTLHGVGQATVSEGNEDMEINITECTNSGGNMLAVAECQDATENSSSFGGTNSGDENNSAMSDVEVESELCRFQMRKRKLTDHWRRFIRPIMWRCKWLELQLKQFKSHASMYDRELAQYDQRKKFECEKFTFEGLAIKSQPFPGQIQRKKLMKRKKRKQVEETADLASYVSFHKVFSYYESKKAVAAAVALDDDNGNGNLAENKSINSNDNFWFNDGSSCLEFRDSDSWSGQILRKIDLVQSQVHKLKTRVDKVVNETPQKFSSINLLSSRVPRDALTGSQNHPSRPESGEKIPVRSQYSSSQHLSEGNMGDIFTTRTAVSRHAELTPFPDMIEVKGQHLAVVSFENTEENILIDNQAAEEELRNFRSDLTQQVEEPKTVSTVISPGDDFPTNSSVQQNVKLLSTSKSKGPKGKRGNRKLGSSRWSRRSSG